VETKEHRHIIHRPTVCSKNDVEFSSIILFFGSLEISENCRQTGMVLLKSTKNCNFPVPIIIFLKFQNKADVIAHYGNTPFWISATIENGWRIDVE